LGNSPQSQKIFLKHWGKSETGGMHHCLRRGWTPLDGRYKKWTLARSQTYI